MDAIGFDLLVDVVDGQFARLTELLQRLPDDERGSTYPAFVRLHLEEIRQRVDEAKGQYAGATVAVKTILAKKLARMRIYLDEIHATLFDHREDIGRRDLPVGILHLIDALVADLLKASADPVVHVDRAYMYSTLRVKDQWEQLSTILGVGWAEPVEPIIFNLPGLDPSNALLSPILAHEVGHSVVQHNDLGQLVDAKLDGQQVGHLEQQYLKDDAGADVDVALEQFGRWVEELLCDALAAELTGPSMLFASAVFLPASAAGHSGSDHPDPAQRLKLTLSQLDAGGWIDPLQQRLPQTLGWLTQISQTGPTAPISPRDTFLRSLVELAVDPIRLVAQDYVDSSLGWEHYEPLEDQLQALIAEGIPPAEVSGTPVSPWLVIASVWLYAMTDLQDRPSALAQPVLDLSLGLFTLKAVEMSRVLSLWSDHAVAQ
ncbi:MAG: hypothetical protein GY788_22950 [bacterium]|nr:hypothetical protein [bacterium]